MIIRFGIYIKFVVLNKIAAILKQKTKNKKQKERTVEVCFDYYYYYYLF